MDEYAFLNRSTFNNASLRMAFDAADLYRVHIQGILGAGLVVNFTAAIYLIAQRSRFLFLPYIAGIIIANLVFLVHLLIHNLSLFTPKINIPEGACAVIIINMAFSSHLPALYLCAISVERFVKIHSARQIVLLTGRCTLRKPGQWICSILISTVSLVLHSWVVFLTSKKMGQCVLVKQEWSRPLELFLMIFDYFGPFTVATTVNCIVLYKLSTVRRVIRLSVIEETTTTHDRTSRRRTRLSSANGSLTRHYCKNKAFTKKKRTFFLFTLIMIADMLLNLPQNLCNVVRLLLPSVADHDMFNTIDTVGFVLWHLQFVVSGLVVSLPLFHKREGQNTAIQSVAASEMVSRPGKSDTQGLNTPRRLTVNGGSQSVRRLSEHLPPPPWPYGNASMERQRSVC